MIFTMFTINNASNGILDGVVIFSNPRSTFIEIHGSSGSSTFGATQLWHATWPPPDADSADLDTSSLVVDDSASDAGGRAVIAMLLSSNSDFGTLISEAVGFPAGVRKCGYCVIHTSYYVGIHDSDRFISHQTTCCVGELWRSRSRTFRRKPYVS